MSKTLLRCTLVALVLGAAAVSESRAHVHWSISIGGPPEPPLPPPWAPGVPPPPPPPGPPLPPPPPPGPMFGPGPIIRIGPSYMPPRWRHHHHRHRHYRPGPPPPPRR